MVFNTPQFVFTLGAFLLCRYLLRNKIKKPALMTAKCFIRHMLMPGTAGIRTKAILSRGLNQFDWLAAARLLNAGVFEVLQVRVFKLYQELQKQNIIRGCVYYLIIVLLVIFSINGPSYDAAVSFI